MIFDIKNKNKENKIKFTINKNNNLINNYYNNIHNLINNNIINHTTKIRKSIIYNKNNNLENLNINKLNSNDTFHSSENYKSIINNNNINNSINALYNNIISHTTKNSKTLFDNYKNNFSFSYKNGENILPKDLRMSNWGFSKNKIIYDENKSKNKNFTNRINNPDILKEKDMNFYSHNNYIHKVKSFNTIDNTASKIKLIKNKMNKNILFNNNFIENKKNENYKYASKTINLNPLKEDKKLNTITADISHSPLIYKFYPNFKNIKNM